MDERAQRRWAAERPGQTHAVDAVCIAPWVSLEFDPQGWVYSCCANQQYPLGRIGEDRLRDLWAGDRAVVLRDALSRWDLSVGCGSCRWHLEHGRMDPDAAVYDRYSLTTPHPSGPASMTFALSNRCNLGCTMCNAELSSTLRRRSGLAPIPPRYDDEFFEDLEAFIPGLSYAKFLGGEPFLVPEHDRVWRLMDRHDAPSRLQVTTNATIWTDRVEWLLERFLVDVTLSIDAVTPDLYESIRVGASHPAMRANVARFHSSCRSHGTELRLCFCLMSQNWHELPEYLAWADSLDAPVSINVVTDVGLALHDLELQQLDSVHASWTSTNERFTLNRHVWATQLTQLEAVIEERRAGVPRAPRQAQPLPDGFFDPPEHVGVNATEVESQLRRLSAWCGAGPVGVIVMDPTGTVVEVLSPLQQLGIDDRLVGGGPDDVKARMVTADGRTPWLLGDERADGAIVRTLVLAASRPERGSAGTIVRSVFVEQDEGWVLLVAQDGIYDR